MKAGAIEFETDSKHKDRQSISPMNKGIRKKLGPVLGSIALFAFSVLVTLMLGLLMRWGSEGLELWFDDYLTTELVLIVLIQLPVVLLIGLTMSTSVLAFKHPVARFSLGFILPLVLCVSMLIGHEVVDSGSFDLERWTGIVAVLLLAILGGMIPSISAVWLLRWQLRMENNAKVSRPFGISDLLMVTAIGAVIIAYERVYGPWSDDGARGFSDLSMLAFVVFSGCVLACISLFFSRLWLVPKETPVTRPLCIAGFLSIALVIGCWSLPLFRQDSPLQSPFLVLAILSVSTVAVSICVMRACCCWLRGCGLWLETPHSTLA